MYDTAEFPPLKEISPIHTLQDQIGDYFQFLTNEYSDNNRILEDKVSIILGTLRKKMDTKSTNINQSIYLCLLDTLFSSIAYVRDIHCGLGLRDATYALLYVWYDFFPMLAISALKHLVSGDYYQYSYGSWHDICGLCDYLRKNSKRGVDHPLIDNAVQIMNACIRDDWVSYQTNGYCSTNCAKWVPREKSKYSWLFDKLVLQWTATHSTKPFHGGIINTSHHKKLYRKMISTMTTFISPIETHMCSKKHANIELNQLHHHALVQNWDTLFNQNDSLDILHENNAERQLCSSNLSQWMKQDTHSFIGFKTPRCKIYKGIHFPHYIGKYVRRAFRCIRYIDSFPEQSSFSSRLTDEINVLNRKWTKISHLWSKTHKTREDDLAIICYDSVSIHDPKMHFAIAQACLVAEWSGVKRILYSAHNPIWIDLDICDGFIAKVRAVYYAIRHENLVCSTRDAANTFLGTDHPFSPLFLTQHGWCDRMQDGDSPYSHFWSILEQSRYKAMHDCFGQITHY